MQIILKWSFERTRFENVKNINNVQVKNVQGTTHKFPKQCYLIWIISGGRLWRDGFSILCVKIFFLLIVNITYFVWESKKDFYRERQIYFSSMIGIVYMFVKICYEIIHLEISICLDFKNGLYWSICIKRKLNKQKDLLVAYDPFRIK